MASQNRIIERKLYPNIAQLQVLETYRIQCCRLYNRALEQRIKVYKRRTVSLYDQQKLLTSQRKRINSLNNVPVEFARDALRRLFQWKHVEQVKNVLSAASLRRKNFLNVVTDVHVESRK